MVAKNTSQSLHFCLTLSAHPDLQTDICALQRAVPWRLYLSLHPGSSHCKPLFTPVSGHLDIQSKSSSDTETCVRCSAQYNGAFTFPYTLGGSQCEMVFTSVSGHLMELEFGEQHRAWRSCAPFDLYRVPIFKVVPEVSGLIP